MNITLPSYILAPFLLLVLYALITVIVFGIKTVYFLYRTDKTPIKKPSGKKVKRQTLPEKSIEINPDEVDKIYVKRIS